jgi:hypothetical protein
MYLKIGQSIDETNTLKVGCQMLTRPPEEIVEVMGVGGVTQVTLRNS